MYNINNINTISTEFANDHCLFRIYFVKNNKTISITIHSSWIHIDYSYPLDKDFFSIEVHKFNAIRFSTCEIAFSIIENKLKQIEYFS